MEPSTIHVLAGVNGSGKSSILGEFIRSNGGNYFNPDSYTKDLMQADPGLSLGDQLLPHLNELSVYDNSESVAQGFSPRPEKLISISAGKIDGGAKSLLRRDFPEWAQPIAMEAIKTFRD